MIRFPPEPGSYALEFTLYQPQRIAIGRLGEIYFPQGEYTYVGSALGPGGLRARLGRHLLKDNFSCHWHIDYIKRNAETRSLCYLMKSSGAIHLISSQAQDKSALPLKPVSAYGARIYPHYHMQTFLPQALAPATVTPDAVPI